MKLVIFGLSISSSWGNGHATLWRGLCRALESLGHTVIFFERDVPYYAAHRDEIAPVGCQLRLYSDWSHVSDSAALELRDADVGIVTSFCADGIAAARLVLESPARVHTFYDLDTPVTLSRLDEGDLVDYLLPEGLAGFDLVLSYTGGEALQRLAASLGARRVAPLYGGVDPDVHRPAPRCSEFESHLSYLGTYAADRQDTLNRLFVESARRLPQMRFAVGGAQYPQNFPWTQNIYFVRHLPPALHPSFYCSSRATLNVTRAAMAKMGYCPSGRLFEAAACGVPLFTDAWEGIEQFYEPGTEILVCHDTNDVADALSRPVADLQKMADAARERTLDEHTAMHRARELESFLEESYCAVDT